MPATTSNDCVVCSKPATFSCKHIDKDGTSSTTWYCGKDCQTSDWLKHKTECNGSKNRTQLYQAGELIQDIFYQFREIVYDIPLSKVGEDANGKLHLYEGKKVAKETMSRFPTLAGLEENDKRAVLCFNACDEALILMYPLLKKTLEGISTKIEEVSFSITTDEHCIVFHNLNESGDGGKPSHTVNSAVPYPAEMLQVHLKDGNIYIVDLGGAQYGQYKAVRSRDEFRTSKLSSAQSPPMSVTNFGFHADLRETQIQGKKPPYKPTVHDNVMLQLIAQLNPKMKPSGDVKSFTILDVAKASMMKDIEKWETEKNMTLPQLLKEKPMKFNEMKTDLVAMVRRKLIAGMERGERKGNAFDKIQPEPYQLHIGPIRPESAARLAELSSMLDKGKGEKENPVARKDGESSEEWAKRFNEFKSGGWDDGLKVAVGDEAEKMLADKEKMAELAKTGGGVFQF